MADIRIRFIGDTAGLRALFSAVDKETNAFVNSSQRASQSVLQRAVGLPSSGKLGNRTGSFIRAATTEFKQYDNVLKSIGNTYARVFEGIGAKGEPIFTDQLIGRAERYHGNISKIVDASANYGRVAQKVSRDVAIANSAEARGIQSVNDQIGAQTELLTKTNRLRAQGAARSAGQARSALPGYNQAINQLRTELAARAQTSAGLRGAARAGFDRNTIPIEQTYNRLLSERASLIGTIGSRTATVNRLNAANNAAVKNDPQLANLRAQIPLLQQQATITRTALGQTLAGASRAVDAAYLAPPPVPRNIATAISRYPALIKELEKFGLGFEAVNGKLARGANLGETLYKQQARFEAPVRNLQRGTTQISGRFLDPLTGESQRFSSELDKAGKPIERFGGQMRGLGRFLQQTVRDFQKVIEWTIATTVVFGGLAAASKVASNVLELDKSLRQFAITAQLSGTEANNAFSKIADIAFQTATPLKELLKSADDIALAMRKAGQSASEWQHDILALTQSVGILTNLTGIDTVKATDLLVSTVKQLNVSAEDSPRILAKITAVAGGQSTAIADIVQGLGTLSEAAGQAGFSLDEMISTLQVLSQVTAKSPSEVAVALKNLFGSVDSAGAVKALQKFGISVRDEAGNLKPFLDIYKEVQAAIASGVIPAGQVKDVIKGISGGPRRAPDAAALLGALDQIFQVEARSINASNEALIANQKILESTSAKVTQLGVLFDEAAFQKFSGTLNAGVSSLIAVLTVLLNIFQAIPVELFTITAGLLAFSIAGKALRGVFLAFRSTNILGFFDLVDKGFRKIAVASNVAKDALAEYAVGQRTLGSTVGFGAKLGGTLLGGKRGVLGIAGLAAGGLALATLANQGKDTQESLSGVASTVTGITGAVLLGIPPLALLGAGLLATSVGFTILGDNARKSREEIESQAEALRQSALSYQDATQKVEELKQRQTVLRAQLERTKAAQDGSASATSALVSVSKEYGQVTADLIVTQDALNESFETMLGLVPGVESGLKIQLDQAKDGLLDAKETAALVQEVTDALLRAKGVLSESNTFELPDRTKIAQSAEQGQYGNVLRQAISAKGQGISLEDLKNQPNLVNQLFDDKGNLLPSFIATTENIKQAEIALGIVYKDNNVVLEDRVAKLREAARYTLTAAGAAQRYNEILGFIEAQELTGALNADQGKAAKDRAALALALETTAASPKATGEQKSALIDQSTKILADLGKAVSAGDLKTTATLINGVTHAWDGLEGISFNEAIIPWLEKMGIDVKILATNLPGATENAQAFFAGLSEGTTGVLEDLDQKLLDLQARKLGGEFEGNAKGFRELRDQLLGARDAALIFASTFNETTVAGQQFYAVFQGQVAPLMAQLPGFFNAANLTSQQFVERLFQVASTMGLTGQQTILLIQKVVALAKAVDLLNGLVANVSIKINLYTRTRASAEGAAADDPRNYPSPVRQAARAVGNIQQQIQKLLGSGKGSGIGKLPGLKSAGAGGGGGGLDVSTLDIPDEIADQSNARRNALVRQAVRQARSLQRKIPGATRDAKNDVVVLLDGMKKVLKVRGVKEDLLRKSLENLAAIEKKRLEFETKADTIRRIRVGAGDFSSIANVPLNSKTGVSLGGAQGPINVSLNINGQILTPAQLKQFADLVAASLKRQIANG